MYCDEGVYNVVRNIQMMRLRILRCSPNDGNISFSEDNFRVHRTISRGSGADMIWLQAGVFGPSIIKNSVLNGGHYKQSLDGLQYLAESIRSLLYTDFLQRNCFLFQRENYQIQYCN